MSNMPDRKVSDLALGLLMPLIGIPIGVWVFAHLYWQLWAWFIVPLGIAQIGVAHAAGLALVMQAVTSNPRDVARLVKETETRRENGESNLSIGLENWGYKAVVLGIWWLAAYIVHLFV